MRRDRGEQKLKIAVDGTNVLAESGESNNNAAGECGGTIL
jgi:hypothetical protein